MLRHLRTAYVIDIESERVHGHYPYHFIATFRLTDSMMPLCKFEQKFDEDDVDEVYEFRVASKVGDDGSPGFYLKPESLVRITTPMAKAKAKASATGEDDLEDDDSCEDLGEGAAPSDLEDACPAVDT